MPNRLHVINIHMITVQTIPLFQSSAAYGKIFGFDKKNLVNEILKLEKNAPSNFRSNAGGFQSLAVDINVPDNRYVSELFNENLIQLNSIFDYFKKENKNNMLNDIIEIYQSKNIIFDVIFCGNFISCV